jgi:pimeloyl-ACP methyl ester carboxylesterase
VILPCEDSGSGPAVVLLHAGVADRRMWQALLAPLSAAGTRLLAPDLPGYGDAPAPERTSAPWLDVLDTIDAAGVERFALAGNSFGAAVAKRVALLAPDRVRALALISPPPEDEEPSPQLAAAWEQEEQALERGDIDAAVQAVLAAWLLPDAPAAQRELVASMQRRALELQAAAGDVPYGPDPLEMDPDGLARLGCPIAVAVGEHDMSDFREIAARLAAKLPGVTLRTIEDAGHLAPLEQPEAVVSLLLGLGVAQAQ